MNAVGTNDNGANAFGKRLRADIKKLGLTQGQFAERLGVSDNTVTNWTRGRYQPDYAHVQQIALELGTSVDEVMGNPEPSTSREAGPTVGPAPSDADQIVETLVALQIGEALSDLAARAPDLMGVLQQAQQHVEERARDRSRQAR